MHTTFSDGKNSIEEMVVKAKELGLKKIAITDHIWKSSIWFKEYALEINRLNSIYNIDIAIGFEAKALHIDGTIDATDDMIKKSEIRIGAIHRIPKEYNIFFTKDEVSGNSELAYFNWFQTTCNLLKNNSVTHVSHPFFALEKYKLSVIKNDIFELFHLAKINNKYLEISYRYKQYNHYLIEQVKNNPNLLTVLYFGSDSHSVDDLKKAWSK